MNAPDPTAGRPAAPSRLTSVPALVAQHTGSPIVPSSSSLSRFSTYVYRDSASARTFNESHLLAVTQAICDYRQEQRISGPVSVGIDTQFRHSHSRLRSSTTTGALPNSRTGS